MENRSSLLDIMDRAATIEAVLTGDVMLDRFVCGRARRIPPETPIPILSITHQSQMPGGAANVVRNIASLGGRAHLVSVVGDDAEGPELEALFNAHGVITPHLLKSVG